MSIHDYTYLPLVSWYRVISLRLIIRTMPLTYSLPMTCCPTSGWYILRGMCSCHGSEGERHVPHTLMVGGLDV